MMLLDMFLTSYEVAVSGTPPSDLKDDKVGFFILVVAWMRVTNATLLYLAKRDFSRLSLRMIVLWAVRSFDVVYHNLKYVVNDVSEDSLRRGAA